MKERAMKRAFGVTHTIVECIDCGWRSESYKNGQAIAARHAKVHAHKVLVEVGLSGYYDGRGEAASNAA